MTLLLDHHDALVYSTDLQLLAPGMWINDRIINFCFRYFEFTEPIIPSSILLMDPAVVSFLRIQCTSPEEFDELGLSLNLSEKSLMMLPCSDSMDFESSSTHWSLVVYDSASRVVFHIDSCHGCNKSSALQLVHKLECLFRYLMINLMNT